MRPGSRPTEELATILGDLSSPGESVGRLLAAGTPAQRLLLVIDQFEELFSQADRAEQARFISALKALRTVESCVLLIAVRADFYPDLMNSDLWPIEPSQRAEIAPLHGQALRRAIERPAADVGVCLEAGLVEKLLADAADEPGVLPLLQETMVVLWEKMQRRLMTLSAYVRLGGEGRSGLGVAVVAKADATLADLTPEQKAIARRIYLRLVQFGEGRADTRRQQSVAELVSASEATLFDQTLRHLADNRLLTLSGEEKASGRKVDIAHEALISGWPTLRDWIKERRSAEQSRRRLEVKAAEWVRLGRKDEAGLLDAVQLVEAEQWLNSPDAVDLGPGDLPALVQTSREAIERVEQEKEAARQRELQQAQALAEERRVRLIETQRLRLISASQALAAQTPRQSARRQDERVALMARQAFLFNESNQGGAIDQIDDALRGVLTLTNFSRILTGHESAVTSVAFAPDGRRLASRGGWGPDRAGLGPGGPRRGPPRPGRPRGWGHLGGVRPGRQAPGLGGWGPDRAGLDCTHSGIGRNGLHEGVA
jgi:hypothetical protein